MIDDRLVLAPGVVTFPTTELPTDVRKLAREGDRVALTRRHARATTKLLDDEAAALIEKFRKPRRLVDAVVELSAERDLDPHELLNRTYPIVKQLFAERTIVDADAGQEAIAPLEVTLAPGARLGPFEVLRCVQHLEGGAVYQARGEDGRLVAVKVATEPTSLGELAREAAVLRAVPGGRLPELVDDGTDGPTAHLALEWLGGERSTTFADRVRRPWVGQRQSQLLAAARSVVAAYADLHRAGLVHGDVHPKNVLVDDDGARVIDVALSLVDGDPELGHARRGGILAFYEPEWAAALVAGRVAPPATRQSDQYALGALVYLMLTGRPYVAMRGDKRTMLRDIVTATPLPFEAHGLRRWPAVETALARALAKDPDDRFESVDELSAALSAAAERQHRRPPPDTARRLLAETEARLSRPGGLVATGLPEAPHASVNYGAAGVGYFWYRLGVLRGEPSHLLTGLRWLGQADRAAGEPDAYTNADLGLLPAKLGDVSVYHSAAGTEAVRALLFNAMGNLAMTDESLRSFVAASRRPCDNLDLTLGRSGTLNAAALVTEACRGTTLARTSGLADLGSELVTALWARLGPQSLDDGELGWWGIAHGWAGVLFATARWCDAVGEPLPPAAATRLDELAERGTVDGGGRRWQGPKDPAMPGSWCHGSTGYVHLWAAAHRITGAPRHRLLALEAAEHSWTSANGASMLCCGTAGQAYAMLVAYQQTGATTWLRRARSLAARSVAAVGTEGSHANSLYKGDVGIALLAEELRDPARASMPLFAPER